MDIYYSSGSIENQIYIIVCAVAAILIGLMALISYCRISKMKSNI